MNECIIGVGALKHCILIESIIRVGCLEGDFKTLYFDRGYHSGGCFKILYFDWGGCFKTCILIEGIIGMGWGALRLLYFD